ncbi:MAG: DUF3299 domain-containing protein [Candidatus Methylacidiphilales bacterium]|nr:DUF3299 domain-containing protein [Candidatus Methylacidiphilales bacterium]
MKTGVRAGAIVVFCAGLAWFALDLFNLAGREARHGPAAWRIGDPITARQAPAPDAKYREITWEELLPAGWDPAAAFKGLDLGALRDGDASAADALAKVQALWQQAPINSQLDRKRVRIPGFVVPLERRGMLIDEFLLVPYFGACIHTPPPPSNQIIHVRTSKPHEGVAMDPVWISGELVVRRADTAMGSAGYHIHAEQVEPYKRQ